MRLCSASRRVSTSPKRSITAARYPARAAASAKERAESATIRAAGGRAEGGRTEGRSADNLAREYQITREGTFPFDDVQIAEEKLANVGYKTFVPKGAPVA